MRIRKIRQRIWKRMSALGQSPRLVTEGMGPLDVIVCKMTPEMVRLAVLRRAVVGEMRDLHNLGQRNGKQFKELREILHELMRREELLLKSTTSQSPRTSRGDLYIRIGQGGYVVVYTMDLSDFYHLLPTELSFTALQGLPVGPN